jgi:hypothetical protein
MALCSLFVNCEGVGSFGTQIVADAPRNAVRDYLLQNGLYEFLAVRGKQLPKKLDKAISANEKFSEKDIFVFTPMDGLVNMDLCQLGRDGKYITIIVAETVPQ